MALFSFPNKMIADRQVADNFMAIARWINSVGGLRDTARREARPVAREEAIGVVADPGYLPPIDSYFSAKDPEQTPSAPTGLTLQGIIGAIVVKWDIPPTARFRKWEVYLDSTVNFTPDTTAFSNRVLVTEECVVTIPNVPVGVNRYVKVCAVNVDGQRSSFVGGSTAVQARQVVANDIANSAISAAKIATGAVTDTKIGTGAVKADALAAGAVDLGSSAVVGNLVADRVAAGTLAADIIYSGEIATDQLAAGTALINEALIGDLSAGKITSGTLGANVVYAGAVTTAQLEAGSAKISNAMITSLDAGKITSGHIDADRIQANSINTNHIAIQGSPLPVTGYSYSGVTPGMIYGTHLVTNNTAGAASLDTLLEFAPYLQSSPLVGLKLMVPAGTNPPQPGIGLSISNPGTLVNVRRWQKEDGTYISHGIPAGTSIKGVELRLTQNSGGLAVGTYHIYFTLMGLFY